MRLFQVSEDPDIKLFNPHYLVKQKTNEDKATVWAIDEMHIIHYFFPEKCPRIALKIGKKTTIADMRTFHLSPGVTVIYIEDKWWCRFKNYPLYLYEFNAKNFRKNDNCIGHYISYVSESPIGVKYIENAYDALKSRGVEIRRISNLRDIIKDIITSSLDYSCIRMRYTKD